MDEGATADEMKERFKLPGNQNVRNTVTGQYAKETEGDQPERVIETDNPCKCTELEYAAKVIDSHLKSARKAEDFDVAEYFLDCVKVLTQAFQEIQEEK
jgi:hypothetical protein